MKKRWVKRAEGRLVRDPATSRPVGDDPVEVPDNSFWRKCLKNGDVIGSAKPVPSIPPPPTAPARANRKQNATE